LEIVVKLLAIPFNHAVTDKLEELLLIATDAELVHQVKFQMQLELTATLKDQHADVTRLSMHLTNAKTAH
jgi:hypothetical protein